MNALTQALAQWPDWNTELDAPPELVQPLNSGLSHQSYLLRAGDQHFVLRLESRTCRELAINKTEEIFWLQATGELSPRVIWSDDLTLVTEFIDLPHWQPERHLDVLGRTLSSLHQRSITTPAFDLLQHIHHYWQKRHDQATMEETALHQQLTDYTRHTLLQYPARVPCHNDLNPSNILIDAQRCVLLDWEYATVNAPGFDLATLIEYGELSTAAIDVMINSYQSDHSLRSSTRAQALAFRPVVRYLQWLWYRLQSESSYRPLQQQCWHRLQKFVHTCL